MKLKQSFCFTLLLVTCIQVSAADTTIVKSPDGAIAFKLYQQNAQLFFTVTHNGRAVINVSPLDMSVDGKSLTQKAVLGNPERATSKESYPVMGVHATATNHYNSAVMAIAANAMKGQLAIRVFNDGASFRFLVPNTTGAVVPTESTVFNLPANSDVWYHDMNMHYESVHQKKKIEELQQGEWMAPPATFKTPQG
ncbi:MAG: glycoside hydrolase, partial [Chitinophagaceae bacterium]